MKRFMIACGVGFGVLFVVSGLLATLITGCRPEEAVTTTETNLKYDQYRIEDDRGTHRARLFDLEFRGHSYLYVDGGQNGAFVHAEDCPCKNP